MSTKYPIIGPPPEGVSVDEHGIWWRPKPGATSTFEDNLAARALFTDLHTDQFWNPWRMEEQAAELERAGQIMAEWERAEPGFRRKTKRQLEAEMARWDRDFKRKGEQRKQRYEENKKRYDPELAENRLALLERRCIVEHTARELDRMRSGEAFPAMDPKRRAEQVGELEEQLVKHRAALQRLIPLVGDPEKVVDEYGQLPSDRRPPMRYYYEDRRVREVRELKERIPQLEAQIKATDDKAERSKLRTKRDFDKYQLEKWLAISRPEIEEMCADCAKPFARHGYVSPPYDSPCPAWPGQRAIHAQTMKMLEEWRKRDEEAKKRAEPVKPKPEPLAILPSGLPIAEVVQRLQELQQQ